MFLTILEKNVRYILTHLSLVESEYCLSFFYFFRKKTDNGLVEVDLVQPILLKEQKSKQSLIPFHYLTHIKSLFKLNIHNPWNIIIFHRHYIEQ